MNDQIQDRTVALPWGAWYQDGVHKIEFPDDWEIDVLVPDDAPAVTVAEIESALDAPINAPALEELARSARTACIAVDDLARPTRCAEILPAVLERLQRGGIARDRIRIVIATGTHGRPSPAGVVRKVGRQPFEAGMVEVHDSRGELADTGIQYGDQRLRLNRSFLEADLKLAIGAVLRHSFAGYSGGAKMMLPGLSNVESAARSHKFVQMGLRGGADPSENRFRKETEQLAAQVGFKFCVCVVPNSRRETAGVFAGDVVAAHRRACETAASVFRTVVDRSYDVLILNAYPKDTDLIQADNALIALRGLRKPLVHDKGALVVATAASEGLGSHGLFGPEGIRYAAPRPKRGFGNRQLILYAPTIDEPTARRRYCKEYPLCRTNEELVAALSVRGGDDIRVGVLPCASMQTIDDQRNV